MNEAVTKSIKSKSCSLRERKENCPKRGHELKSSFMIVCRHLCRKEV